MTRRRLVGTLLAALLGAGATNAQAFLGTCTVSAGSTNFGSYNPFDVAPLDGAGNVQVTCSVLNLLGDLLVSYTIALSPGGSGSFAGRRLASGSTPLGYNLYTDPTRAAVWGDGSGGTGTVSDSYLLQILSRALSYPVYGRIPAGQNVPPGLYADTITVTVNY